MFLIDTDILIYSLKGDQQVNEAFSQRAKHPKAISVISYGELLYGANKSDQPEKNLAQARYLAELFPIISVTPHLVETFASLKNQLESQGNRLDDFDLIIGATALSLNHILVTNNERHFSRIPGLKLENWAH